MSGVELTSHARPPRHLPEQQGPLRIAHVITCLLNAGAEENTAISCNHAARSGHEVTLVHGGDASPEILARLDDRVQVIGLPKLVRPIAPVADVGALRDLVQVLRALGPDVVHTHNSKAGVLGRLAARIAGAPVIVHGVHIVPFVNVGRLEALVYRAAERVVAGVTHAFIDVSPTTRDLFVESGIGAPSRHHVVYSGFDLSRFRDAELPREWRDLLRLEPADPRPPVLLMLAAFEPRKRHLEFLDAFPKIVAAFPDVRLILAGDGELRDRVEARVEALGVERNVIMTGFHPHPEQLIALADVCVLASAREGLPRVVMQCLAGGKPVVAANLPGLDEVLRDDVNGLVTASDDLVALADAVLVLLHDDAERARLARGAANTDLSRWEAALMGGRIESVYARVMRERMPHRFSTRREAIVS